MKKNCRCNKLKDRQKELPCNLHEWIKIFDKYIYIYYILCSVEGLNCIIFIAALNFTVDSCQYKHNRITRLGVSQFNGKKKVARKNCDKFKCIKQVFSGRRSCGEVFYLPSSVLDPVRSIFLEILNPDFSTLIGSET